MSREFHKVVYSEQEGESNNSGSESDESASLEVNCEEKNSISNAVQRTGEQGVSMQNMTRKLGDKGSLVPSAEIKSFASYTFKKKHSLSSDNQMPFSQQSLGLREQ